MRDFLTIDGSMGEGGGIVKNGEPIALIDELIAGVMNEAGVA